MISLDYPSSLRFSPEKLAAEELCALDFGTITPARWITPP